jgi:hypothetical protein
MSLVRVQIAPDWQDRARRRWLVIETRSSGTVVKPCPDEQEARMAAFLRTHVADFFQGATWVSGQFPSSQGRASG